MSEKKPATAAAKSADKKVPRQKLTCEKVLAEALLLVDAEGLEALSMRRLAERLGVKAMSLYNHVANKEAVIDGLVELVVAEMGSPDQTLPWRQAMELRADNARKVLLAHPWATMPLVSRINAGPVMLHYVDDTLGCLLKAGFSLSEADYAWNAMDSYIYGFTLQELNFPFEAEEYAEVAKSYVAMIPPEEYPNLNALTHEVIAKRHLGIQDFSFGFSMVLDGLEKLLTGR